MTHEEPTLSLAEEAAGFVLSFKGRDLIRHSMSAGKSPLTGSTDVGKELIRKSAATVTNLSLAPVVAFDTEEEVIKRANDTVYGLAAYVYTRDLSRAFRVAEALEAGSVGVNDAVPSTSNCPFGGMKESGLGRELGSEGLDAFLETKHISLAGI